MTDSQYDDRPEGEEVLPSVQDHQRGDRWMRTAEGASAFAIDDPLAHLYFTYGSFLPGSDTYYGSPDEMMRGFLEAVERAGRSHPERTLQYAALLRDPRGGRGNRSQPPWVMAVLCGLPACLSHPRFAELVARCIVRPDDALSIIQAALIRLGGDSLPHPLAQGLAQGLGAMSEYQLAKYANAELDQLPEKWQSDRHRALPAPRARGGAGGRAVPSKVAALPAPSEETDTGASPRGRKTLRLVDALGMCKGELNPRLRALHDYLHAPTRRQGALLARLGDQLPALAAQRRLRAAPPRSVREVQAWVEQALAARMTME